MHGFTRDLRRAKAKCSAFVIICDAKTYKCNEQRFVGVYLFKPSHEAIDSESQCRVNPNVITRSSLKYNCVLLDTYYLTDEVLPVW
jgi:hypothetical protein